MGRLWAEFSNPKVDSDGILRHKLYQLGDDWVHRVYGPFKITPEIHAEIVKNFNPEDPTYTNLSYNHRAEDVSAGKLLSIEPNLDDEGWAWGTSLLTPQAIEQVNTGQYRGFSPEIEFKGTQTRTGKRVTGAFLAGGSLTNIPFFPIQFSKSKRDRLAASSQLKSAFQVDSTTGDTPMDPLASTWDASTLTLTVTLPAGITLADGTMLDADTPVAVTLPDELIKILQPDEAAEPDNMGDMPKTAVMSAAMQEQFKAQEVRLAGLEASNKRMAGLLEQERALRFSAEADNFLNSKRVKPSLREEIKGIYLSAGVDKANKLLAAIGDSAFVPEGEIGSGADKPSVFSFIETQRAALKASNPALRMSQIDVMLSREYPKEFEIYERGNN